MASMDEALAHMTAEQKEMVDRQLAAYGYEAQSKISQTSVLVIGLKGVGAEVAKNVILSGVGAVGLHDNGATEAADLGGNFYLSASDIGNPRGASCAARLGELNRYCTVEAIEEVTDSTYSKYKVVVVTNKTIKEQIAINKKCREFGCAFIAGDAKGLLAGVFCDHGPSFMCVDPTGEQEKQGVIGSITKANPGVVTMHEEHRHDLETGDFVTFNEIRGMTELNDIKQPIRIKVKDPYTFEICDTSAFGDYAGPGGIFMQEKLPKEFKFLSLEESLADANNTQFVFDLTFRSPGMHCLYLALSEFEEENKRSPDPTAWTDAEAILEKAKAIAAKYSFELGEEKSILGLARCAGADLNPMCAFLGGVMGQEALKAASQKFTPIQQHLYFQAEACLPTEIDLKSCAPQNSRYDSEIAVFGSALVQKIHEVNTFIIGAGAIGCEMLKNFALMGVATDAKKGSITITDMDIIETSNLSRQFLFRSSDVKQLKSECAARAVKTINPDINISASALRVGGETENIFHDEFWEGLDVAITALDNVEARRYVDQRCIFFGKPMIDSGTQGTKGNTQVVIPNMTESYGTSEDPPETGIAVCTLKFFPYEISHTIQYARDEFEGLFTSKPQEANSFLEKDSYVEENRANPEQLNCLRTVIEYLKDDKPSTLQDCIRWARVYFEKSFNHQIKALLEKYPADATDKKTGVPFWSGKKRLPTPVEFDMKDETHLEFIISAANLRAFNFGIPEERNPQVFLDALPSIEVPEFVPFSVPTDQFAATEEEAEELKKKAMEQVAQSGDEATQLEAKLPERKTFPDEFRLVPADFEKDDPTNFHMDFITAYSNLRAGIYKIPPKSKHQTKHIAGKIIPAIATTTALVTGLVCLELYKVLQGDKTIDDYFNGYVNLALSIFSYSNPVEPPKLKAQTGPDTTWEYNLWNFLDFKDPATRLRDVVAAIEARGLALDLLTFNNINIYSSFNKSAHKKLLKTKMKKLAKEAVAPEKLPKFAKSIMFTAICVYEGEVQQIPQVRVTIRDALKLKSAENEEAES